MENSNVRREYKKTNNSKALIKRSSKRVSFGNLETVQKLATTCSNYSLQTTNPFAMKLQEQKEFLVKTLAYRLDNQHITEDIICYTLSTLSRSPCFSLMNFLESLLNDSYTSTMLLRDFISICTKGKVISWSAEAVGIKELLEWVNEGITNFQEIEDCYYWMSGPTRPFNFKNSLVSLKNALNHFEAIKVKDQYGRWQGSNPSANGRHFNYSSKEERNLEILKNRDYTDNRVLEVYNEQKERMKMFNYK